MTDKDEAPAAPDALIARLRTAGNLGSQLPSADMREAADRLEALTAERDNFFLYYRMRHDEETKLVNDDLHNRAERAAAALAALTAELEQEREFHAITRGMRREAEAALAERDKLLLLVKEALGDWEDGTGEQHTHYCSNCDNSIDGSRKIRDAIDAAIRASAKAKP